MKNLAKTTAEPCEALKVINCTVCECEKPKSVAEIAGC
tara:strand:- start:622 stop:735 length:114 start_codon:yes stop_codon:yes gene_type:complete